eukprot:GHVU01129961.1.p1 GENE.GHVU01129961.1~~GHVU01129961.1.p1  ORF type:complete len:1864 (+),score=166.79 GHVU01129961.1:1614-7205(+)
MPSGFIHEDHHVFPISHGALVEAMEAADVGEAGVISLVVDVAATTALSTFNLSTKFYLKVYGSKLRVPSLSPTRTVVKVPARRNATITLHHYLERDADPFYISSGCPHLSESNGEIEIEWHMSIFISPNELKASHADVQDMLWKHGKGEKLQGFHKSLSHVISSSRLVPGSQYVVTAAARYGDTVDQEAVEHRFLLIVEDIVTPQPQLSLPAVLSTKCPFVAHSVTNRSQKKSDSAAATETKYDVSSAAGGILTHRELTFRWTCYRFTSRGSALAWEGMSPGVPPLMARPCLSGTNERLSVEAGDRKSQYELANERDVLNIEANSLKAGVDIVVVNVTDGGTNTSFARSAITHIFGNEVPLSIETKPFASNMFASRRPFEASAVGLFTSACSTWVDKLETIFLKAAIRPLDGETHKMTEVRVSPSSISISDASELEKILVHSITPDDLQPNVEYELVLFAADTQESLRDDAVRSLEERTNNQVQTVRWPTTFQIEGFSKSHIHGRLQHDWHTEPPSPLPFVHPLTVWLLESSGGHEVSILHYSFWITDSIHGISENSTVIYSSSSSSSLNGQGGDPFATIVFNGRQRTAYVWVQAADVHGPACSVPCDSPSTTNARVECGTRDGLLPQCPYLVVSPLPHAETDAQTPADYLRTANNKFADPKLLARAIEAISSVVAMPRGPWESASFGDEGVVLVTTALRKALKLVTESQSDVGGIGAVIGGVKETLGGLQRTGEIANPETADIFLRLVHDVVALSEHSWTLRRSRSAIELVARSLEVTSTPRICTYIMNSIEVVKRSTSELAMKEQRPVHAELPSFMLEAQVFRRSQLGRRNRQGRFTLPILWKDRRAVIRTTEELDEGGNKTRAVSRVHDFKSFDWCEDNTMTVVSVDWVYNPYAFNDANNPSLLEPANASAATLEIRMCDQPISVSKLENNVSFFLQLGPEILQKANKNSLEPVCVSWESENKEWKTDGCEVTSFNSESSVLSCSCSHLATFSAALKPISGVPSSRSGRSPASLGALLEYWRFMAYAKEPLKTDTGLFYLMMNVQLGLLIPFIFLAAIQDKRRLEKPWQQIKSFFPDAYSISPTKRERVQLYNSIFFLGRNFIPSIYISLDHYMKKMVCVWDWMLPAPKIKEIKEIVNEAELSRKPVVFVPPEQTESSALLPVHKQESNAELKLRRSLAYCLKAGRRFVKQNSHLDGIRAMQEVPYGGFIDFCNRSIFGYTAEFAGTCKRQALAVLEILIAMDFYASLKRLTKKNSEEEKESELAARRKLTSVRVRLMQEHQTSLIQELEAHQRSMDARLDVKFVNGALLSPWLVNVRVLEGISWEEQKTYQLEHEWYHNEEEEERGSGSLTCYMWTTYAGKYWCFHPVKSLQTQEARKNVRWLQPLKMIDKTQMVRMEQPEFGVLEFFDKNDTLVIRIQLSSQEQAATAESIEKLFKLSGWTEEDESMGQERAIMDVDAFQGNPILIGSANSIVSAYFDYDTPIPITSIDCHINGRLSHAFWSHEGLVLNFQRSRGPRISQLVAAAGEEGAPDRICRVDTMFTPATSQSTSIAAAELAAGPDEPNLPKKRSEEGDTKGDTEGDSENQESLIAAELLSGDPYYEDRVEEKCLTDFYGLVDHFIADSTTDTPAVSMIPGLFGKLCSVRGYYLSRLKSVNVIDRTSELSESNLESGYGQLVQLDFDDGKEIQVGFHSLGIANSFVDKIRTNKKNLDSVVLESGTGGGGHEAQSNGSVDGDHSGERTPVFQGLTSCGTWMRTNGVDPLLATTLATMIYHLLSGALALTGAVLRRGTFFHYIGRRSMTHTHSQVRLSAVLASLSPLSFPACITGYLVFDCAHCHWSHCAASRHARHLHNRKVVS